jgi:hypothetical protein
MDFNTGLVLGYGLGIATWVMFLLLRKSIVQDAITQLKKDGLYNGNGDKKK